MSDSREYITRQDESGSINISEEVIAIISLESMIGVQGVGGISSAHGKDISDILTRKNATKGVRVHVEESTITIDVYIMVKYGSVVNDVANRVQSEISEAVESMTGFSVSAVNVHVTGIAFDKDKQ